MPGIAGIVSKGPMAQNRASLEAMLRTMLHESFYNCGSWSSEKLGLCVGWTCLSGSFGDCLPIWNEAKDICLLFSGEHFADAAECDALQAQGHRFEVGNASYLVHLYEETGPSFLERLNGWFSGLLVDLRENKVLLFNDRYGTNRVYWHENEQGFYFASEAKALLKVLPQTRRLNYGSLAEFFSCGCVLQDRSFFSGISLLPGAAAWSLSAGQPPHKSSYFDRSAWEKQPQLSPEEYYQQLHSVWNRILPRYFQGPQAVGLSLTGGLDSRMILACAGRAPGTLPCYTFGGPYRDCADVTISRQVAKACQQSHETISLTREYLGQFPALAARVSYLTDGTLDATGSADLFVQKRAREIGPIRVTGLNGGELLRRLIMFKPAPLSQELLAPEFAAQVQGAARTYTGELDCHRVSFTMFKQAPWHLHARLALERTQLTIRTPYFDNHLVALAYQAPPESTNYQPALRLIAEGAPALQRIGTDRARLIQAIPGLTQIQHLFQEFTFKAEYAYDYGMPQWLVRLDHMVAPLHLERLFLGRHKFYHFRLWFRDEFSGFLREVLLDSRACNRAYLNAGFLKKMVEEHTAGRANFTYPIQRVLAAELLQRTLLEQNG